MKKHDHHSRAQTDRPFGFQNLTVYKRIMEYLALEHAASRGFPADLREQLDSAADSISTSPTLSISNLNSPSPSTSSSWSW